jgi:hypothetical protein|tara:strand:+ start:531 stop:1448 length:918 start_codon:yes stop_codon:yes gene_type:complete
MAEIETTGKLAISFSGGRTSALMTKLLIERFPEREILITFANTGVEHEDTLRFVRDCDEKLFNGKVNWIEAVVNEKHGKGVGFKITNFKDASRKGEPYRAAVEKYGLFNVIVKSCTSRLKVDPMEKFLKTKGYRRGKKLNYDTAIGIRSDEVDRISEKRKEFRLIYPLVAWGITKQMVLAECAKWDFDLKIEEHFGNCVGCFKKTIRKLATVSLEDPKQFDFWKDIEEKHKNNKATTASSDPKTGLRRIYRKHQTVDDIFEIARKPGFKPYRPKMKIQQLGLFDELDHGGGCGESCEVYSDENLK